jgi:hypothetical protein
LDVSPDEREQARRVLETLFLWVMSLPDNLRDGLTALDVAEAAWLTDDAVGAESQAEHLLTKLVQGGYPVRTEKKTRDGKDVVVYSYETSVAQDNPARFFGPLKKKAKEDTKLQDSKWTESLFWQLADITAEAQQALGVNGGISRTSNRPTSDLLKSAWRGNLRNISSPTEQRPPPSVHTRFSTAEKWLSATVGGRSLAMRSRMQTNTFASSISPQTGGRR